MSLLPCTQAEHDAILDEVGRGCCHMGESTPMNVACIQQQDLNTCRCAVICSTGRYQKSPKARSVAMKLQVPVLLCHVVYRLHASHIYHGYAAQHHVSAASTGVLIQHSDLQLQRNYAHGRPMALGTIALQRAWMGRARTRSTALALPASGSAPLSLLQEGMLRWEPQDDLHSCCADLCQVQGAHAFWAGLLVITPQILLT